MDHHHHGGSAYRWDSVVFRSSEKIAPGNADIEKGKLISSVQKSSSVTEIAGEGETERRHEDPTPVLEYDADDAHPNLNLRRRSSVRSNIVPVPVGAL